MANAAKKRSSTIAVLAVKTAMRSVDPPDDMIVSVTRRFPKVTFHVVPFDPSRIEHLDEADILYAYTITPALLTAAPKLAWFHSVITGPDKYAFPELIKRKIIVTSPHGVYSIPMAETVLGLMLSFARKTHDCFKLQAAGRWGAVDIYDSVPQASELYGSTVVVVGLGGIGTAVAERCRSLGMNVVAVVPTKRRKPSLVDKLVMFERSDEAIRCADFLVMACPLTKKTKGMLGKRELSMMKRSSYLINVARVEIVDENALIDALRDGTIGGAAADVFTTEPLPEGHPFYTLPNMIVLPHVSGWSGRFWERAVARFEENLERFLAGRELIGEVDFSRGY